MMLPEGIDNPETDCAVAWSRTDVTVFVLVALVVVAVVVVAFVAFADGLAACVGIDAVERAEPVDAVPAEPAAAVAEPGACEGEVGGVVVLVAAATVCGAVPILAGEDVAGCATKLIQPKIAMNRLASK
ncbi:MAG: hypothetical protein ACRDV3_15345 [Acidothermaceae bacterium]